MHPHGLLTLNPSFLSLCNEFICDAKVVIAHYKLFTLQTYSIHVKNIKKCDCNNDLSFR